MKARLSFAISMAIDFDFYIIDEISAAGDKSFKLKAEKMLEEKFKKSDFLVVDHSLRAIKKFCNRFFILNNRSIEEFSTINEAEKFYDSLNK